MPHRAAPLGLSPMHSHPTTDPLGVFADSRTSELGTLQLLNGPNRCAGRVEVLHDHMWGTVCDDGWDLMDATVVCRQLGCGTALMATKGAHYGRGQDPIWLDEVNCTGTEATIFDCKARAWGVNNCYHGEDAGVVCSGNSCLDLPTQKAKSQHPKILVGVLKGVSGMLRSTGGMRCILECSPAASLCRAGEHLQHAGRQVAMKRLLPPLQPCVQC